MQLVAGRHRKFEKIRNLSPIFKNCVSPTAAYGKTVQIFHSRWVLYVQEQNLEIRIYCMDFV